MSDFSMGFELLPGKIRKSTDTRRLTHEMLAQSDALWIVADPLVIFIRLVITPIVVVFPAPLGPSNP